MQATMYDLKRTPRIAYEKMLDASETLDHFDSVIRYKIALFRGFESWHEVA